MAPTDPFPVVPGASTGAQGALWLLTGCGARELVWGFVEGSGEGSCGNGEDEECPHFLGTGTLFWEHREAISSLRLPSFS